MDHDLATELWNLTKTLPPLRLAECYWDMGYRVTPRGDWFCDDRLVRIGEVASVIPVTLEAIRELTLRGPGWALQDSWEEMGLCPRQPRGLEDAQGRRVPLTKAAGMLSRIHPFLTPRAALLALQEAV